MDAGGVGGAGDAGVQRMQGVLEVQGLEPMVRSLIEEQYGKALVKLAKSAAGREEISLVRPSWNTAHPAPHTTPSKTTFRTPVPGEACLGECPDSHGDGWSQPHPGDRHLSPFTCHMSPVTFNMPPVT